MAHSNDARRAKRYVRRDEQPPRRQPRPVPRRERTRGQAVLRATREVV